ncbi:MAG: fasciclin domain-containing protein, partial [Bacteroidota bacterium]
LNAQCGSAKTETAAVHNVNYYKAHHKKHKDIVDTAASLDMFSTLVTAVKTAGLVETLKSKGPFTVFAPTNSAFAKLPESTLKSLLAPSGKKQLTKILTYHVVAGSFKAKDVVAAIKASGGSFSIKTVSGDTLKASLSNGNVVLTDENGGTSAVIKTDVNTSNGIIHVIDTVVLPK